MSQPELLPARRILAAGLSPAWQQILVFDEFRPGEVNRASQVHWCASGKVLNVGIALAHFGTSDAVARSRVLSVIGPRARAAIDPEFAAISVDCRWIAMKAETRVCTTVVDGLTGRTTELVENASPLMPDEIAGFRRAFTEEAAAADVVVVTGSLPPGIPTTFYRELLGTTSARAVLDIRGPELLAALECRPFCIKPNREELRKTFGREFHTDEDLHGAMRELNDRGAQWVVITDGAKPVWASHQGKLYRFEPPYIEHVVNPIASGDCLAAGIAWATASGAAMVDAIRFGIAAAADNAGQLLPARLDLERIAALERRITPVAQALVASKLLRFK